MGLIIDGLRLPVERWQIDEILEARLKQYYNTTFKDFFLVTAGDKFHSTRIETKYGKLLAFFTPECPATSVYILNKKRFSYPVAKNLYKNYDKNGDLINHELTKDKLLS